MSDAAPIRAKCNCGAVTLEVTGAPVAQFYCHCDHCQSVHGAGFVPVMMFPIDQVKTVGPTTIYTLQVTPRHSCSICGTRLFAEPGGMGVRGVVAGLLPRELFQPAFHVQCQHAVLPVRDELPKFKGYPAALGGSDEVVSW